MPAKYVMHSPSRHLVTASRRFGNFRYSCLIVPIVQSILLLTLIWTQTPQVPTYDEWVTVDLIQRFDEGNLRFADLWTFHAQHRIVVPRLINLVFIELTGWNRQVGMTFNLLVALLATLILLLCVRTTFASSIAPLLLSVPFSLLALSLAQYENWLQPFQIAFIATIFGHTLATWAIVYRHPSYVSLLIGILGATIASLSSFAGIVSWFVLIPFLCINRRYKLRCIVAWSSIGILLTVAYLDGFPIPNESREPYKLWLPILRFTLINLGAPVGFPSLALSEFAGITSICVLLVNLIAGRWIAAKPYEMYSWLGLSSFALCSAIITAMGRIMIGYEQALQSRYQALTMVWWISVLMIAVHSFANCVGLSRTPMWSRLGYFGVVLLLINLVTIIAIIVGALRTNVESVGRAFASMAIQRENQQCVVYYRMCPDEYVGFFYGDVDAFRRRANYLDRRNLAIFANFHRPYLASLLRIEGQTDFDINTVGGEIFTRRRQKRVEVSGSTPLKIEGWAIDEPAGKAAGGVFISVDESVDIPAAYGRSRPDVSAYFDHGDYLYSGFYTLIPVEYLEPGLHRISIKIVSWDKASYYAPDWELEILVANRMDDSSSLSGDE